MYLDEEAQKKLRQDNIINENEVLVKEGDIFVAVNVISQSRRIVKLDNANILEAGLATKPQLLKG